MTLLTTFPRLSHVINQLGGDETYWRASPYSVYITALTRGVITEDELEAAKRHYGPDRWHYTGD